MIINPAFDIKDRGFRVQASYEGSPNVEITRAGHDAGTWCSVHGWLSFASVQIPPLERAA